MYVGSRWRGGARSLFALVAVLGFLAVGLGCEGDDDGGLDPTVTPASGIVGAGGGTVASDGVSIEVPPGALAVDVELAIAAAAVPAEIAGVTAVGATVEIGPAGTTFQTPATVTVPVQAGAVPDGADMDDVRLYVADSASGPFVALDSTVDAAGGRVSAAVAHLSVFVPGVVTPSAPICERHEDCDCEEVFAALPLDVTGSADVGRSIQTFCLDALAGEITVLSHTWKESSSGLREPDAYFLGVLDAETLAVKSDAPTDQTVLEPEGATCTGRYQEASYLNGEDLARGLSWSAEVREIRESGTGQADWYEEVLTVSGEQGTLRFSLNRHLNQAPPYTDTNSLLREWLLDPRNALAARVAPNGSARFYFYAWHELHIDVVLVDDLMGRLAGAGAAEVDEHGFHTPTARTRLELRDGATASGYGFRPLYVHDAPDDPAEDILVVFGAMAPPVRGYRVSGEGTIVAEQLPDLGLDEIYGQFGWQNAGLGPGGLLYIQAQAAQFDASVLHTLDPRAFEVVDTWEVACIGAPTVDGFQLVRPDDDQLLRFAQPPLNPEDRQTARIEFLRGGSLQAIGEVPVNSVPSMWLLVGAPTGRLYVADQEQGLLTAIAVPP